VYRKGCPSKGLWEAMPPPSLRMKNEREGAHAGIGDRSGDMVRSEDHTPDSYAFGLGGVYMGEESAWRGWTIKAHFPPRSKDGHLGLVPRFELSCGPRVPGMELASGVEA